MHDLEIFEELLKSIGCSTWGLQKRGPLSYYREKKLLVNSIFATQEFLQCLMNNPNFLAARMAYQDYTEFKMKRIQDPREIRVHIKKVLTCIYRMIGRLSLMYRDSVLGVKYYEDLPAPLDNFTCVSIRVTDIPEGLGVHENLKKILLYRLNNTILFIPHGLEAPLVFPWVDVEEMRCEVEHGCVNLIYTVSKQQPIWYNGKKIPVVTIGDIPVYMNYIGDCLLYGFPRYSCTLFSWCFPLEVLFLFREEEWTSFIKGVIYSAVKRARGG